jgi:hypothetical protein
MVLFDDWNLHDSGEHLNQRGRRDDQLLHGFWFRIYWNRSAVCRRPEMKWLLPLLSISAIAQEPQWHANSVWAIPVPVNGTSLSIPTSHSRFGTSLVAFMTTTNTPGLIGDLRGATITATIQIVETNSPMWWFGNDCGSGVRFPNVRLFFTTVIEPYPLAYANAHELEFWWAKEAFARVQQGTITLTAHLDPAKWGDSQGHSGETEPYRAGFLSAASRVAQIGLSFGGGCFFDTGIGIYNPDNPESSAALILLEYKAIRPRLVIDGLEPRIADGWEPMQYSDNLRDWKDMPASEPSNTRFYRIKP